MIRRGLTANSITVPSDFWTLYYCTGELLSVFSIDAIEQRNCDDAVEQWRYNKEKKAGQKGHEI